jgi:RND family efflux transporter MFP subunit
MRRLLVLVLFGAVGCGSTPPPAPSTSEKPKAEADLAFATITKKAYAALQIRTEPATPREVHEQQTYTGWVMAKPGQEVVLTAPVAGQVHFGGRVPIAGEKVEAKHELLQMEPVLSPVEQIQVSSLKRGIEGELNKAKTTLKTAEADFQRVGDLAKQNLRSQQEVELAKKGYDHAVEELAAAQDKLKFFRFDKLMFTVPMRGTILQVHAGPGQYVAAGAPLVSIIDLHPVWLRVPIPEFDLPSIDLAGKATVSFKHGDTNGDKQAKFWTARPAGRVSQVDPLKHTAELWYELENVGDAERFWKDQMLTVRIPIGKKQLASVVPDSAVVFDAHGGAWIYLDQTKDKSVKHQFERRRVELATPMDAGFVVRPTLAEGERVVVNGAAALFSREFHKTPVTVPGEDD